MGVEVPHDCSWILGGQQQQLATAPGIRQGGLQPLLESARVAAAHDCSQNPGGWWWWWLATTSVAGADSSSGSGL